MDNQSNNIWSVLNNLPEQDVQQQELLCSTSSGTGRSGTHELYVGTDAYHTPIPALPTLLALLIVQIGLLASMFVLPEFHETLPISTNSFSMLQYVYVISWAIIAFLSWQLHVEFYNIWLLGYHNFHSTTKHLHTAAFHIYTAGLVLMCVLCTSMNDYCKDGPRKPCGQHLQLSPVNYQQIIVVLLSAVSVLLTIKLIGEVVRFNQGELPADVLVDDLGVRLSQSTLYVGIGRPRIIQTLLEVQGSTIGALQHKVGVLNRQIAVLANTMEEYMQESNGPSFMED